jgi:hypothetical protein
MGIDAISSTISAVAKPDSRVEGRWSQTVGCIGGWDAGWNGGPWDGGGGGGVRWVAWGGNGRPPRDGDGAAGGAAGGGGCVVLGLARELPHAEQKVDVDGLSVRHLWQTAIAEAP